MSEDDAEARAAKHAAHGLQLRAAEQAGHDKRIRTAEEELAAWSEARRAADRHQTVEEREKAERLKLYTKLKARDALHVYYHFYPDERPRTDRDHTREDRGRGR